MKENTTNDRNDELNNDNDQLRSNTINETIREVNGGPDMNINNLRNSDNVLDNESGTAPDTDSTEGVGYNPNDASGVRSGGTADMDDQTAGGAGLNTTPGRGQGSNLSPKMGTTGSDYDGQNSTS